MGTPRSGRARISPAGTSDDNEITTDTQGLVIMMQMSTLVVPALRSLILSQSLCDMRMQMSTTVVPASRLRVLSQSLCD